MQRVTGAVGGDLAGDRPSDQREVAKKIEDLVPDKFVAEAQRPVHDVVVAEDDAVFNRSTASETRRAHLLDVANESECPRRCDFPDEAVLLIVELERLLSN